MTTAPVPGPVSGSPRAWLLSAAPASRTQARFGRWFRAWLGFRRNPLAMSGLGIVLLLVLMAVFAPLIVDRQATTLQVLADRLQPASWQHLFGTDELGRDIFARVVFGSRITLTIVAMVGVIVVPVGLAIGLPAGYFGGVVDTVLMRITDIFLAFPRLVLALAFAAALGPGIENAVIAIALTAWPPYARLARAETLTSRRAEFIQAAELQGASSLRIIATQIVPLCLPGYQQREVADLRGGGHPSRSHLDLAHPPESGTAFGLKPGQKLVWSP